MDYMDEDEPREPVAVIENVNGGSEKSEQRNVGADQKKKVLAQGLKESIRSAARQPVRRLRPGR
jgi:hypothetical protein